MTNTPPFLVFALQWLLIISFLIYGASCFLSAKIKQEFDRFKLSHLRKITGALQLAACLGLVLGFYSPWLVTITALGLSVMMLSAFIVRLRLKDSLLQTAPAALYLFLSLFLLFKSLSH
jgi:hypothetical protein